MFEKIKYFFSEERLREKRLKKLKEFADEVERKAMDEYAELVLTMNRGIHYREYPLNE